MRRIKKLIATIQAYCDDGVVPDGESAQTLAAEYASICADTNRRLHRCAQLIEKGNLGEAVRLSRMKPDLLRVCLLLDFDGVAYWRDIIGRRRFSPSEPIDDTARDALVAACRSASVLDPLMRQYRAAVQRRNEEECICILRQLIDIDPGNANWCEDLRRFEHKRLGALEQDVMGAATRGDRERLEELLEELQGAWTVRVKRGLKADAVKHLDRIRREEAAVRYKELLAELDGVEARGDVGAGRAALSAWQDLHAQGLVLLDDEASATVARVRDWVEQSDRDEARERAFSLKLAELKREMAKDQPDRDVAPLLKALQAMKLALPDGVATEARGVSARYRANVRRARARRRRRILLGISGLCVTLLCVAWFGALQTRCRLASDAMASAFEAQDLPAFDGAFAATAGRGILFGNRVRQSAAVRAWQARRPELVDEYARRVSQNRQVWARLDAVREAAFAETSENIQGLLSEAQHWSLGPDDLQRIADFRAEWYAAKEKALRELITRLDGHMVQDDAFTTLTVAAFDERVDRIKSLLAEGRAIEPVPESLQSELGAFSMRLSSLERMAHGRRDRLDAMTKATKVTDYVEAIGAYVDAYPQDQLAVSLNPIVVRAMHFRYIEAIKPAPNYIEGSARIPFARLVVDTYYPAIPPENYFWVEPVTRLEKTHRSLEAKWPGIKASLLSLRDDRYLVSLWEYQESPGAPLRFVDVHELTALPGDGDTVVECPVYTPGFRDSSPSFRTEAVKTRDVHLLRPMAHCEFLAKMISEAMRLDPSEGDDYLLRKTAELVRLEGMPSEFLRSSLLLFLVQQYLELGLESDLQAAFKPAFLELARLGDRVGVSWLCGQNRYVKEADAEATILINRHFSGAEAIAAHRFERMLAVAAIGRAAEFVGAATADGLPPGGLRRQGVCEVWVLRPTGEDRCGVEVAAETGAEGVLSWTCALQPGEPLFAPRGETCSRELVVRFQEASGAALPDGRGVNWPPAWPQNRRGI